jgi:hypothetical protein
LPAQNAELLAVIVDDAQLRRPNLLIQAGVFGYDLSPLIINSFKVPGIVTDGVSEVNDIAYSLIVWRQ